MTIKIAVLKVGFSFK